MKPTSDITELAAEIASMLRLHVDANTAAVRALRRGLSRRIKTWPPQDVLRLGLIVMSGPSCMARFVAYELIAKHRLALASLQEKDLLRLGSGLDSWAAVDCFACYLAGPAWRAGQIEDELIRSWTLSQDRWWRRAALVATVPLNNKTQGGSGDAPRTWAICRLLCHDRDDMVVKALSWALRELAKRDPAAVRNFVARHEQDLAARVLREVRSKLTTGKKNPGRIRG